MSQVNPRDLRTAYIFSTLTDEELHSLAVQVECESHAAGDMIFRFNEVGDAIYIVQSGTVDLFVKDRTGSEVCVFCRWKPDTSSENYRCWIIGHGQRVHARSAMFKCSWFDATRL